MLFQRAFSSRFSGHGLCEVANHVTKLAILSPFG